MYNRIGNLFFRKRTKEQVIIPSVNLQKFPVPVKMQQRNRFFFTFSNPHKITRLGCLVYETSTERLSRLHYVSHYEQVFINNIYPKQTWPVYREFAYI